MWNVHLNRKVIRKISELPADVRRKAYKLIETLEKLGPVRGDWPNYSKLSDGSHHCHLKYRYVACWKETEKGISVEVYYVGSREKAPY